MVAWEWRKEPDARSLAPLKNLLEDLFEIMKERLDGSYFRVTDRLGVKVYSRCLLSLYSFGIFNL